ncbi:MAG: AEC family transporter [Halobacteria archaeon]|nr:AEC family transporter [Halobacteria archaeon]
MSLVSAFTTAIAPILGITGVGYLLGTRFEIDVESVNTVALYFFVPALVFHSLTTTDLGGRAVASLSVGVVAYALGMMSLGYVASKILGEPRSVASVVVLSSAFPNSGFIGVPLSEFAFGEVGRTTAVLFLTVQNLLVYTLGVYVASSGTADTRESLIEILRLPLIYAVVAAVIVRYLGVLPSESVMETVRLVGDASIPLMLTVLGVQLVDVDLGRTSFSRIALPTSLKLVVAPAVGLVIASAVGFDDPTVADVFVLESATPAAVIPLALTIAYSDLDDEDVSPPEYMSTVILVTTVGSIVTLTLLITALRSNLL